MSITQAEHDVSNNQPIPSRTRTGDALLFARNFFRHPRMLGSIVPSSRFLIKQLLQPIDWHQARVIVEYGPGVGCITAEILRRMRSDAVLIAIELNPDFVSHLRSSLRDERLKVVEGSAEAVGEILESFGRGKANYIISGIPFSTLSAPSSCSSSPHACSKTCNASSIMSAASSSRSTCCRRTSFSVSSERHSRRG